jgi:CRP-like cAMP-binding protein
MRIIFIYDSIIQLVWREKKYPRLHFASAQKFLREGARGVNNMLVLLNKCSLFNHLSVSSVEALLRGITFSIKSYKRHEVIFSPLCPVNALGVILTGAVEAQKLLSSGKVVTVSKRFPYDLIADVSLFADTDYYPSTVSACENSHIWLINKTELQKLFARDNTLMLKFLESVANRALALSNALELFSLRSVNAKIAHFLAIEQRRRNDNTITLQFSKKSLAEQLNVSRPTLSRELKKMQQSGIIACHKRTIVILDYNKLLALRDQ